MKRRILVDDVRKQQTSKRGSCGIRLSLDEDSELGARSDVNLSDLDDALQILEKPDPQQERVVKLPYFGGLTIEATSEPLGISPRP